MVMKIQTRLRFLGVFAIALHFFVVAMPVNGEAPVAEEEGLGQTKTYRLQDFETDRLWSLDSANNYGIVGFSTAHVTSGKKCMKVRFVSNGRNNTMFRREVDYDLSGAEKLVVDVFNHATEPGVSFGLAFKTRSGGFFETDTWHLAPGWNKALEFYIGRYGMKFGTDSAKWQVERTGVERIMFMVYPGENKDGFLSIDNLRCDSPSVDKSAPPVLVSSGRIPDTVKQFEQVEIAFEFEAESLMREAANDEEFIPRLLPVDLQMRLADPYGSERHIKGFLLAETDAEKGKPATVSYGIRFTPTMPGNWRARVDLKAGKIWVSLLEKRFKCPEDLTARGMIGVDRDDPMFFSFAKGEFFYPIGQNICWAADYEPYFKEIKEYGGNIARVWVCPWNNPVLKKHDSYSIDLESATAWDKVFDLANKYGVYIQLVLAHHGALAGEWDRTSFNAENGGPCVLPQDFWVSWEARKAYRNYLSYVIARWAHHPNLFAWELMNETDLTPRYGDYDIIAWHEEMGKFIKSNDPYNHPVTTSLCNRKGFTALPAVSVIDFTNCHFYDPNVTGRLNQEYLSYKQYNKPYFVGETGRGWQADSDQVDKKGVHLHHALWLAWMTPAAGNALPWWWDTYIEPNNLQYHFAALTAFDKGEDRRGKNYRGWIDSLTQDNKIRAQVQGLVNRNSVFAFIYNLDWVKDPNVMRGKTMLEDGHLIKLEGMLDGKYEMKIFNTYTGKVAGIQHLMCDDGILKIPLPEAPRDFALKVKHAEASDITVSAE